MVRLGARFGAPFIAILCWAVGGTLLLSRVTNIFGLPVVDLGYFAPSYYSAGLVSVGGFTLGVVSVGVLSIGIVSIGVVSLGIFSIGIFSIGYYALGIYLGVKAVRRRNKKKALVVLGA